MHVDFDGELWWWKGPAPFHFVSVPDDDCVELQEAAAFVSYGWGMIPVTVRIGATEWTTSLWPKDGGYVVPIKDRIRKAEELELGDVVSVHLFVDA